MKEVLKRKKKMFAEVLHVLYPKRCPICDRILGSWVRLGEYPVCDDCRKKIIYVTEPVCKKCGKPISNERGEFCHDCRRHSHAFIQGKGLWVYKGAVKTSIYRLKYGNRREYGIAYGQALVEQYGDWIQRNGIQAIIPIPLHKKRKRQRGYNQAEIIAREIGRQMDIPVFTKLLIRCVHTRPQKELNDKERKNNLKKAFKMTENNVQLRQILLVDDIYTTGSTIDGAAGALLEAGVERIYFVSVSIGRGYQ